MEDKDIKEFHDLDKLNQYHPLPSGLTVADSRISGQGLFTTRRLVMGTTLGISHYRIDGEYIRTPLGGFINHSDEPKLPVSDCKVKFKNKQGKEYIVEIERLIKVFNNNIWQNQRSVK